MDSGKLKLTKYPRPVGKWIKWIDCFPSVVIGIKWMLKQSITCGIKSRR